MTTRAVSATELARQWGRVMDAVRKGDHVLVMNHARPQAVIVPADWYDWMVREASRLHDGEPGAAGEARRELGAAGDTPGHTS